jgi:hypothetical protein
MPSESIPERRLIRQNDLFAMLGLSKASGHRALASGKIGPVAIRLCGLRYDLNDVHAWINEGRCCDRQA